ncbi:LuxR C-terminal-related transcriptional regulator [Rhodococcus kronopolitis]|uniref:LuxR C-terminal-related transcriptional regulator n=1 Tax=Rhodococcus kronopolitis TaxID=1460226 RepID=A0ABV9FUU2_9NOCA
MQRPRIVPAAPQATPVARPALIRPTLSARETEVLLRWLHCDSKSAVASAMYLSLGTVNTHLARIRAKYAQVDRAAPTKAALVARAVQDGLISIDEL